MRLNTKIKLKVLSRKLYNEMNIIIKLLIECNTEMLQQKSLLNTLNTLIVKRHAQLVFSMKYS